MSGGSTNEHTSDLPAEENVPCLLSKRWILAYTSFVGFVLVYATRVNISMAIICMVRSDDYNNHNNSHNDSVLRGHDIVNETGPCGSLHHEVSVTEGEFDWDKSVRSRVLAMYFYGYIFTQLPGGWLAARYGTRRVWGYAMTLVGVCTTLTPIGARTSVYLLYALRFLIGFGAGVSFPAMHSMFGRWSPKFERSKLISFSYSGAAVGTILTFGLSGFMCAYGFDNGWGSIFYLTGGGTLLWAVVWFFVVADTPSQHNTITELEQDFIENSIGLKGGLKRDSTPWLAMLKSAPLWAIIFAHVCNNYTNYTLLTSLPTFMKEVLKYDIRQNGMLSSLPYLCTCISAICAGQLADIVRAKHILSTTLVRKIWQNTSFWLAASFLVGAGFVTCEQRVVGVVLLCLCVSAMGINKAGYMVSHVDIAPRYSGVLLGISNTLATIPGMIAPLVAGVLTPNKTAEEWRNVFYVCAALAVAGAILYGCLISGELQPWARDKDTERAALPENDESDRTNDEKERRNN
ncbi:sialin-like [Gigantopelta aegis]|uniref:sialin-like n=1 Tax=Gigantopelta aegis TaxID=1735272 RepID=UPI001B88C813|nr:sialin-like [Gigantopelta aegis]